MQRVADMARNDQLGRLADSINGLLDLTKKASGGPYRLN